jgi:hypothetical protein
MFIEQISVFLENHNGALREMTELLGKGGIDLLALSVADTQNFGIIRIIVSSEQTDAALLERKHEFDFFLGQNLVKHPVFRVFIRHCSGIFDKITVGDHITEFQDEFRLFGISRDIVRIDFHIPSVQVIDHSVFLFFQHIISSHTFSVITSYQKPISLRNRHSDKVFKLYGTFRFASDSSYNEGKKQEKTHHVF